MLNNSTMYGSSLIPRVLVITFVITCVDSAYERTRLGLNNMTIDNSSSGVTALDTSTSMTFESQCSMYGGNSDLCNEIKHAQHCFYDCDSMTCVQLYAKFPFDEWTNEFKCEMNTKEIYCNELTNECIWDCSNSMIMHSIEAIGASDSCCTALDDECENNLKLACDSVYHCVWNQQNCTSIFKECITYTEIACISVADCVWNEHNCTTNDKDCMFYTEIACASLSRCSYNL